MYAPPRRLLVALPLAAVLVGPAACLQPAGFATFRPKDAKLAVGCSEKRGRAPAKVLVDVSFRGLAGGKPTEMVVEIAGDDPIMAEAYLPVDLGEDELAAYAGTYYSEELDAKYDFRVDEGELVARGPDREEVTLSSVMQDLFSVTGAALVFSRDEEHGVTGFTLDAGRVKNLVFEKMY